MPNWREDEPVSLQPISTTSLESQSKSNIPEQQHGLVAHALQQWDLAWAEFARTRGYTWVKRGHGLLWFLLLTGAGQSLFGIAQFLFPFLPVYGWVITFLLTTLLAQGFVIHFSGRARLRELQERKLLEEAKPTLDILYDDNDPVYKDDSGPSGNGFYYKTRQIAIVSSTGGDAVLFVPKVTLETGSTRSAIYLKPVAHQPETLYPKLPSYWLVVNMNTQKRTIKLMRKGGTEYLLGPEAEFEIIARCGETERRKIVRTRIVETVHEGIDDQTGQSSTFTSVSLQFRLDDI
jgi:hypothetical protein